MRNKTSLEEVSFNTMPFRYELTDKFYLHFSIGITMMLILAWIYQCTAEPPTEKDKNDLKYKITACAGIY